jgi:5-methylcytosine-specific restriction protein A
MKVTESLTPHENQRVIDLVAAAGVDVGPWAESSKGPVQIPASNPAYCYEWAFTEPGRVVALNVWHGEIREQNGAVWCNLNLRAWADKGKHTEALLPSEKSALSKRAVRMDQAIAYAFDNRLPVRIIVGDGTQRDISNPKSKTASRMKLRLLDPEPWSVERYNKKTGACRLSRGTAPRYIDQFTKPEPRQPQQRDVSGKAWERDRKVRDTALLRAAGKCESCGNQGFRMAGGGVYLETHHVVPLSEKGVDHERNVVALCPNDHREAHHGECRDAIRTRLLAMLADVYGR